MTKKEWFEELKGIVAASDYKDVDGAVEFIDHQIEVLDSKAEKAAVRAQAKKEAGDELRAIVLEAVTDEPQGAAEITATVAETVPDISRAKVIARLTQLVNSGAVQKAQVKGEGGSRMMVYSIATGEDGE